MPRVPWSSFDCGNRNASPSSFPQLLKCSLLHPICSQFLPNSFVAFLGLIYAIGATSRPLHQCHQRSPVVWTVKQRWHLTISVRQRTVTAIGKMWKMNMICIQLLKWTGLRSSPTIFKDIMGHNTLEPQLFGEPYHRVWLSDLLKFLINHVIESKSVFKSIGCRPLKGYPQI